MTKQDVDDALDFGIAAADRLEPPGTGVRRQIASETLQRITLGHQYVANHEGLGFWASRNY